MFDINKPRTVELINNSTIPTDGRGSEFVLSAPNSGFIAQGEIANNLTGANKVALKNAGGTVIGYAVLVGAEYTIAKLLIL